MNDITPLHGDSLDEGLRSALLQIDRGPALTVDVDEVLRRGARHRRLVTLERVAAVAAVALVVVGVGSFAVGRTTIPDATSTPASSLSPSAKPPTVIAVAPKSMVGSSGTKGDVNLKRGLTGMEIANIGSEAMTVSIQGSTASGATIKAVLKAVPPSQQDRIIFDDALTGSVDRPGPASVTVPAGMHLLLVMAVDITTCPSTRAAVNAMADSVSSTVTLSLRSASGGTATMRVTESEAHWVRIGLVYACGYAPKT
jgi:hypothetical protein